MFSSIVNNTAAVDLGDTTKYHSATYQLVVAASWNNVAAATMKQGSPEEIMSLFVQALRLMKIVGWSSDESGDGILCAKRLNQQKQLMITNGTTQQQHTAICNTTTPTTSLLTSFELGDTLDDANKSPLCIFGRPILIDSHRLVAQQRPYQHQHIVAAVVMYNAGLLYQCMMMQQPKNRREHEQMADLYYRACLSHTECALNSGICTVQEVSLLLLATWNNRAHLHCSVVTTTTRQCLERMRCLLADCRLTRDECRIFHLNCFLLEHLGSGLAPAA